MNCTQIVFSPTGGVSRAADILANGLADAVKVVDLSDAAAELSACALGPCDVAVIAAPSFGGRVPGLAIQRLKQINGQGTKAVVLCVYGNRAYEDTLLELADAAKEANFRVIAGVAAVAEHSIVRQYAAGRPDAGDEAALKGIAKRIAEKLSGEVQEEPKLPGNRPYKKAGGGGLVPKAGSACTACGRCAARCPAQAISKTDLKHADAAKCISCMRCVAECPAKARSVNKLMVGAAAAALKKACSVRKECELYLSANWDPAVER